MAETYEFRFKLVRNTVFCLFCLFLFFCLRFFVRFFSSFLFLGLSFSFILLYSVLLQLYKKYLSHSLFFKKKTNKTKQNERDGRVTIGCMSADGVRQVLLDTDTFPKNPMYSAVDPVFGKGNHEEDKIYTGLFCLFFVSCFVLFCFLFEIGKTEKNDYSFSGN